jgi:tRNA U34 5-methylaminomethyl-2-thiouridine-forming methyltransferase MnmC
MENVRLLESGDGSHTLYNAQLDETYHSTHGALTESRHVFIAHGLVPFLEKQPEAAVLEIGFGTGLNALLSLEKAVEMGKKITYHTLETFPLPAEVVNGLNYSQYFSPTLFEPFLAMHQAPWNGETVISENFLLTKLNTPLQEFSSSVLFDVIYFDAFAPRKQPEMWSAENMEKAIRNLKKGGIFVTYCATGQLRRDLKTLGLEVEKLPGPPGKREMTRGWK